MLPRRKPVLAGPGCSLLEDSCQAAKAQEKKSKSCLWQKPAKSDPFLSFSAPLRLGAFAREILRVDADLLLRPFRSWLPISVN